MSSQAPRPWLVITLSLVAMVAGCRGQSETGSQPASQEKPSTGKSVARFATSDFVAGCCVRPSPLIKDPLFGSLPIYTYLPAPVSLGRLNALDVEELVVFCGPATDHKPDDKRSTNIEWSAATRTSQPIDLKTVMQQWRQSLVPEERPADASPVSVRIGNQECYRVPAGSFFPPPREYGELRFTDRNGESVEQGVNVGRIYEYRSYVEGKSKASAIFTLDDLDEADLVDGHLPLELRLDVFLTYYLDREYSIAQIELRNPATGLCRSPIKIEAKSYVNRRLDIPYQLPVADTTGKREGDLFQDLVSNGRLEVVLKGTLEGVCIGVGPYDLNVRPRALRSDLVDSMSQAGLQATCGSMALPAGTATATRW